MKLRLQDLRPGVIYKSPLGLLCQLVHGPHAADNKGRAVLHFEYVAKFADRAPDGFSLTSENVGILTKP